MTQPTQRVLYLPPGVVAAPPPTPVPQSQSGLPFDRAFFEQLGAPTRLSGHNIPAAVAACEQVTGQRVSHAVLKGRSNYACLLRVRV